MLFLSILLLCVRSAPPYSVVGVYDTSDTAQSVYVDPGHQYVYVADQHDGVDVLDISDSENPSFVGNTDTFMAFDVFYFDGYVYVADDDDGLRIVDVGTPSAPSIVGTLDSPSAWAVIVTNDVDGDIAFVAEQGYRGLHIVDCNDKANPALIGSIYLNGNCDAVRRVGDYAFVTCQGTGFHVVNITDKTDPTLVTTLYTVEGISSALGLDIAGNYAYVADGSDGLKIVDISAPATPSVIGTFGDVGGGTAIDVRIQGDYAYLLLQNYQPLVIDISTPSAPTLFQTISGTFTVSSFCYSGIAVDGNILYVANAQTGLSVVQLECPDGWKGPNCETPENCTESDCEANDGVCVIGTHCACYSGYGGTTCGDMSTCLTWETADPLATGFVPELKDTSMIQSDNIVLNFESPVVTERYNYRLLVGGVEENVCDSWYGTGWTQGWDDCTVLNDGVLNWNDVENDCGWDTSETTDDLAVFKNTINFKVVEDLDIIQRNIEWDFDIKISIPTTVIVDVIDIDVLSPEDTVAILFGQNVNPGGLTGYFDLFTRVSYPYILESPTVTSDPSLISSSFGFSSEVCLDESGNCDQQWRNNLNFHPSKCDVSGTYEYQFFLNCRTGYTTCPYEDEVITITTQIVSENFCDTLQLDTDITATMESFEDASHITHENGFILTDTAYFLVDVTSEELTLYESEILTVWLDGDTDIYLVVDGLITVDGTNAGFQSTNAVDPYFQFDLASVPVDDYTVRAKVGVTYEFETTRRRSVSSGTYSLHTEKLIGLHEDEDIEEDSSTSLVPAFGLF